MNIREILVQIGFSKQAKVTAFKCEEDDTDYDPNLPNLLYIGCKLAHLSPYKINVFPMFSFTNICINGIIKLWHYTYVRRELAWHPWSI